MKVVLSVIALSVSGSFASMAAAPVVAFTASEQKSAQPKVALKARVALIQADLQGDPGRQSAAGSSSRGALIGEGSRTLRNP